MSPVARVGTCAAHSTSTRPNRPGPCALTSARRRKAAAQDRAAPRTPVVCVCTSRAPLSCHARLSHAGARPSGASVRSYARARCVLFSVCARPYAPTSRTRDRLDQTARSLAHLHRHSDARGRAERLWRLSRLHVARRPRRPQRLCARPRSQHLRPRLLHPFRGSAGSTPEASRGGSSSLRAAAYLFVCLFSRPQPPTALGPSRGVRSVYSEHTVPCERTAALERAAVHGVHLRCIHPTSILAASLADTRTGHAWRCACRVAARGVVVGCVVWAGVRAYTTTLSRRAISAASLADTRTGHAWRCACRVAARGVTVGCVVWAGARVHNNFITARYFGRFFGRYTYGACVAVCMPSGSARRHGWLCCLGGCARTHKTAGATSGTARYAASVLLVCASACYCCCCWWACTCLL